MVGIEKPALNQRRLDKVLNRVNRTGEAPELRPGQAGEICFAYFLASKHEIHSLLINTLELRFR
jgi:hypothetical protein